MPPKIKDIAEDAGVSIATVSRVLNNSQPVSEELRRRVLESVKKLNYQPNALARSLRTRRSLVIGALVPNVRNPYFTDIVRAVEDLALEAGYVVTICSSDQDLERERRYIETLRHRMVDGVLVAVADRSRSDLSPLVEGGIPVVLADRALDCTTCDMVTVDVRRGAYQAVEYLIARGYRRIGIITGPQSVSTAVGKLEGYREALERYGLPVTPAFIVDGGYTEEGGTKAARQMLAKADPPRAVVVSNNLMALGFFRVVREQGLRVPEDIAFVSFDDSTWASLVTPPVTLVDQPTYEVGKIATELLLNRLQADEADALSPRHVVLQPRMIVRGSA